MRRLIKGTCYFISGFCSVLIGATVLAFLYVNLSGEADSARFTYDDLIKIRPAAVMDAHTLLSQERTKQFHDDLLNNLIKDEVIAIHPLFGIVPNPTKLPYSVNIIIDSGGGYVTAGFILSSLVDQLQAVGVQTKCFVSNAQSMAFYFMVTSCDYVVMKKGATLMQHKARHQGGGYSTRTEMIDLEMATAEAAELGVDLKEWLEFTRGSTKDRVFTEADIKKYGLVDEVME